MTMRFTPTELPGVWIVEPDPLADSRGFFARLWDHEEFAARGLNPNLAQISMSNNILAGTVRGMHWQAPPHEEAIEIFIELITTAQLTTNLRKIEHFALSKDVAQPLERMQLSPYVADKPNETQLLKLISEKLHERS